MKKISIIGGGISGLTVLHYLKQRLRDSAQITLFEREASAGGAIRSFHHDSCLFEWGPNSFLNQNTSLQLIEELGLSSQLIDAQKSASQRYIQSQGTLKIVPMNPWDLVTSSLLSFQDKCSLIPGLFKRSISTDTSIYNYVSQRFTPNIAESIIDPLMSGIYAGNIKHLHMTSAFPKLKRKGPGKTRVRSLKRGMGEIIHALSERNKTSIQTNREIHAVEPTADITIIATPAYAAAKIVENINPLLRVMLDQIAYAPIAVAGLLFKRGSFKKKPGGFGYLVPSKENKDTLGVLIESNIFLERAKDNHIMVRVMMGGAHHPAIINDSQEVITQKAVREIDDVYGLNNHPIETFVKLWPKAIPQYELNYPQLRQSIADQCGKTPGLYLCANYLDGISFNDCIKNAKSLAAVINI